MKLRLLAVGVLVLGCGWVRAAETGAVKVTVAQDVMTVENGLVSVAFDVAKGTLSATSGGGEAFLRDVKFGRPRVMPSQVAVVRGRLSGTGFEVERADGGGVDRVTLSTESPLVFFERTLRNAGDKQVVVDKITTVSAPVVLPKGPKDLRVLGCDGLTAGTEARVSYTFLAAADPQTRAGVVAGWVTNERASGIALSKAEGNGITIDGRSEYGTLRMEPGAKEEGEIFAIGRFNDCLVGLETYADAIAKANSVKLKPIPSGYCTWYSRPHGGAADEKSLAELATFVNEKLAPYGFDLVQIDDKWQVSNRDYTTHKPNGPYASGMQKTAEMLRANGLTAGIWLIPFGWDPKRPAFEGKQDYFVHRPDGTLYEVKWAGTCLDMTHPGARELLAETISRITREWGYKYLKVDGLWTGLAVEILYPKPTYRPDKLGEAVFHDPSKTNVDAYRMGLRQLRAAAGPDVFIDGCNIAQNFRTLGASMGLVDAMRVGRDIGAAWEKILPSMEMASRLYFFHGRVWHNDPDCLMLREPLTLDQARAWGSWIALSGQLNLVSEWLPGLPEDRLEIVKRSMPNTGLCGRPIDLFQEPEYPRVWLLSSGTGAMRRDVVGLFNWDKEKPAKVSVSLEKLGLEQGDYVGFDYWGKKFVAVNGTVEAELPAGSCKVIALRRRAQGTPVVVSTSRHITQGVIDLKEETWDGKTLGGVSKVVGGEAYEVRIAGPRAEREVGMSMEDNAKGVKIEVENQGANTRLIIRSPGSREVRWKVGY